MDKTHTHDLLDLISHSPPPQVSIGVNTKSTLNISGVVGHNGFPDYRCQCKKHLKYINNYIPLTEVMSWYKNVSFFLLVSQMSRGHTLIHKKRDISPFQECFPSFRKVGLTLKQRYFFWVSYILWSNEKPNNTVSGYWYQANICIFPFWEMFLFDFLALKIITEKQTISLEKPSLLLKIARKNSLTF